MGVQRFDILRQISQADQDSLHRIAEEISRCYFRSSIELAVHWGIPSASEPNEPKAVIEELGPELRLKLEDAVKHFIGRRYHEAKNALEPLVEIRHEEASKLYVKVLQLLQDPSWFDIAAKINKVSTDTLYVAAGSTEVREGQKVILVHPGLSKSVGYDAPKCVTRYVVHHEMLHEHLGTVAEDPHPPLLRRFDASFPERNRALRWLQKYHFSTIENA